MTGQQARLTYEKDEWVAAENLRLYSPENEGWSSCLVVKVSCHT